MMKRIFYTILLASTLCSPLIADELEVISGLDKDADLPVINENFRKKDVEIKAIDSRVTELEGDAFTPTTANALSGSVIQTVYSESATAVAVTAVFNNDDTPPLYSEGNLIISGSITPTNASNKIRITFSCSGEASTGMNVIAFLTDATGSDPAIQVTYINESVGYHHLPLTKTVTAGGTSAITFYILGGVSSGTFNVSKSTLFADTAFITLQLEEIKA